MELHHDEQILYAKTPSWRSQMGSHALVLIVAILVGAVVLLVVDPDWIGVVVGIVIALLGTAWLWIERSKTKYIVTTHRLHVREGFLSKHVQETRLRRIQNVSISQTVPQRILRVGTVDYDTAGGGEDGSNFRMLGVEHPDALVRLVDKAQRAIFDAEREHAARAEAEADAAVRARETERPAASGPEDPTRPA